ncbi:MAG: 23S rRNA (pseudouridine(1915)-N(3))-methyltransferase RlmH [Alphaproteobacteria bacterium]
MHVTILSIGRFKQSALGELYATYEKRLSWKLNLKELDPKLSLNISVDQRKEKESATLVEHIPQDAFVIALDEKGQEISSLEFAEMVRGLQQKSLSPCFIIGGADGLSNDIKKRSQAKISFGRCTWPHLMVRVLLIEQLYRAQQILANHPYHKT